MSELYDFLSDAQSQSTQKVTIGAAPERVQIALCVLCGSAFIVRYRSGFGPSGQELGRF
jgi:hypothetical protein